MMKGIKASFLDFFKLFGLGIKYALYFFGVAAIMGFVFGAIGGVWLAPAFVAVSYLGIFVLINFFFAFVLGMLNFFPAIFGKGSKMLNRYFTFSLAFLVVFLAYFALLKLSNVTIF